MTIWLSLPKFLIPKSKVPRATQVIDSLYKRICLAYEHPIHVAPVDFQIPLFFGKETEDYSATVIKNVLGELEKDFRKREVEIVIDCRSSPAIGGSAPTYKLVAKAGLRTSLPLALSEQYGSEVGQAINFLQHTHWDKDNVVIISAVQRIVAPDNRLFSSCLPLADAASAIAVTKIPLPFTTNFRVLSVDSAQVKEFKASCLASLVNRVVEKANKKVNSVTWAIAHNLPIERQATIHKILPQATWLSRETHLSVDFGCADVLVSLQEIAFTNSLARDEIGVLWFFGRYGAVILVLVEFHPVC